MINCESPLCVCTYVQVDLLWQSSPVKAKDGMNGSFEVQVRQVLKRGVEGVGGERVVEYIQRTTSTYASEK